MCDVHKLLAYAIDKHDARLHRQSGQHLGERVVVESIETARANAFCRVRDSTLLGIFDVQLIVPRSALLMTAELQQPSHLITSEITERTLVHLLWGGASYFAEPLTVGNAVRCSDVFFFNM